MHHHARTIANGVLPASAAESHHGQAQCRRRHAVGCRRTFRRSLRTGGSKGNSPDANATTGASIVVIAARRINVPIRSAESSPFAGAAGSSQSGKVGIVPPRCAALSGAPAERNNMPE